MVLGARVGVPQGLHRSLIALPCLSANLISSFLLIAMLFVISLSLLIGVVKVRAWSGEGRGARTWGLVLVFRPTGWMALAAERMGGRDFWRPQVHLEILTLTVWKAPFLHGILGLEAWAPC